MCGRSIITERILYVWIIAHRLHRTSPLQGLVLVPHNLIAPMFDFHLQLQLPDHLVLLGAQRAQPAQLPPGQLVRIAVIRTGRRQYLAQVLVRVVRRVPEQLRAGELQVVVAQLHFQIGVRIAERVGGGWR